MPWWASCRKYGGLTIGIITVEQVEYMLREVYPPQKLKEQLLGSHEFYLAYIHEELADFGSIDCSTPDDYSMQNLYIDQTAQKTGLGRSVFHAMLADKSGEIKLRVNRLNIGAINFYFKQGFNIESVDDKDIGGGYQMNDFIMSRTI